ncbi:ATP-binding protein [Balneolales bacterium ANBcel1]|nr:ATP-binding protein [Balneolales bacterium ANBcel1]
MAKETDARARILIVEDELIIAQNLKIRLEKLGYGVTDITIDAEETRTSLAREVPDLVLMDIALYGGNDGVILAKWIDKNYKIPVIFVTSHTDSSTFERASKSMPYGYLIKPFNPKELYNAIELALQRHKLLRQLSSSSHLLGSVLQSISDAIVVTDKQRNILYMNDSACKLLQVRFQDTGKMTVDELLPFQNPDDGQAPEEWNLARVRDYEEVEFECRLDIRGRKTFQQVRLSKLENRIQSDVPDGYLVVLRDVTRRKRSESIILNIAEAVSGEIGDAYFQRLTGQITETLQVDFCFLGIVDQDHPEFCTIAAMGSRIPDSPKPARFPLSGSFTELVLSRNESVVCQNNAGSRFPDDTLITDLKIDGFAALPLISGDGRTVGVIAALNMGELEMMNMQSSVLQIFANRAAAEIERQRYEENIIAERNRANEMNTLKNNFLSNLSHEVRTPLNSIIGFSSLLIEELDDEEQLKFLTYITDGGKRLLQTINDLLDISLLESKPGGLQFHEIDLAAEIRETVGMMQNEARDKDLTIGYPDEDRDIRVMGDHHMAGQVLRKVVGNAIKFTEEGSVTIELDTASRENGNYVLVLVKDTGIGIDTDFIPHVFDEFKQESRGMARKYEGVGLGLTIARKMMHLMGGFIEVESEKDKGSVFTLCFPAAN